MLQKIVEKVVLSNFCLGVTGEGLQNLVLVEVLEKYF